MNFLAHFVLSYPDPELMAGNFIADFLNKKEQDSLDICLYKGVEMHQWIDQYTDSHPNISSFNRFFNPVIGHYAPVASDISMDYFLYKNWNKYIDVSYLEFSKLAYDALRIHDYLFPEKPRNTAHRMIEGDWLRQYTSLEGMKYVMYRMNQRAKYKVDFTLTIPIIEVEEEKMNSLFIEFFEQAQIAAKEWKLVN
ncbi:MAG: DUF479 domain-containing protein [Saprospiraceae bacterium]|nr:DUF479 domain-containing protein [Saprospiraceae bacterium]